MSTAEAVNDIKLLAARFQAIVSLGTELERLGSLETAASETQDRLNALGVAEAKAVNDLQLAKDSIQAAQDAAALIAKQAQDYRDADMLNADKLAAQTIATANASASSILDAAQNQAAKVILETQARVLEFQKLAAAASDQAKASSDLIATNTATLADLESRLAIAKAQVAKLLG